MKTKIENRLNFFSGAVEQIEVELDPFEALVGDSEVSLYVTYPVDSQVMEMDGVEYLVNKDEIGDFLARFGIEPQI